MWVWYLVISEHRMSIFDRLRIRLFSQNLSEHHIRERLGASYSDEVSKKLVQVLYQSILGYNIAICHTDINAMIEQLESDAMGYQAWRYEGASVALTLLDLSTPWKRNRWQGLSQRAKDRYPLIIHAGVGVALQRYPWPINIVSYINRFDPLYRHMIVDAWGMFKGLRSQIANKEIHEIPQKIKGDFLACHDHGLGRSIWFAQLGNIETIHRIFKTFPTDRQNNLWPGVGLALAYASSDVVDDATLQYLLGLPVKDRIGIGLGITWAADSRVREGGLTPRLESICQQLTQLSSPSLHERIEDVFQRTPKNMPGLSAYRFCRQSITDQLKQLLT